MRSRELPLRVLVLEDSDADAELVVRQLRRTVECAVERATGEAEFLAGLDAGPDLILADYSLPSYDALAALRALRTRASGVPLIVISGTIGEEAAAECLREGATDYLLKDRLGRLGQAALNAVAQSRLHVNERRMVEALRASEERYRTLFDDAPNPIWLVDAESLRFLEVNRKAISHYGWSREEFLDKSLLDIRPSDDLPGALEGIAAVLAGRPLVGRRRHLTRRGELLDVAVSSRVVSLGGRRAILAIIDDVTEKARLEAQLQQSQKMEAIGQLAGGVAHDFNNALAAILGYAEMLAARAADRRDLLPPVEQIRLAAERAAGLTRQLLAFSRRQDLQPRVLDLNEVVAGIEPMLRPLLGEDLRFTLGLRGGPCPVLADRTQLEQVIVNLAVNARDAMPGGGSLWIETALVDAGAADGAARVGAFRDAVLPPPARREVVLAVRDTGCGMDEATRARIFEPFFTTKEPGRGTGLGLATVYGVVHQSGGRLEVESAPGRGSTFRVFLPCDAGPTAAAPAPPPSAGGGGETVLLLEDDAALRRLYGMLLEEGGYTVLAPHTASAAIPLATEHAGPIHLLLTDLVMPEMSGPEVAARVQEIRPHTRVLFVSGYPGGAHHGGAPHPGSAPRTAAPILAKPFSHQELLRQVRRILDGGGGPGAAEAPA